MFALLFDGRRRIAQVEGLAVLSRPAGLRACAIVRRQRLVELARAIQAFGGAGENRRVGHTGARDHLLGKQSLRGAAKSAMRLIDFAHSRRGFRLPCGGL